MKLEEIKNKTNEAVSYLVAALESGQSDVLTQYLNAMARFHNYSFGKHHAHRPAESHDMLLYLAGVNEHAALRIVGSKRWRVSHLLRTIQFFSTMEFTSQRLKATLPTIRELAVRAQRLKRALAGRLWDMADRRYH